MELTGKIIKRPFGKDSKSEHEAIVLDTGQEQYVLRRRGGNPFRDPELEKLIGKTIRARGDLTGYTFLMTDWEDA